MFHNPLKMSDLARPRFKANPHEVYAWLRAEAPVYRTRFLGRPAWLVTRYDDVAQLLREDGVVKDWPPVTRWIHFVCHPLTQHMLNKDGIDHARLRRVGHSAFTSGVIEQLRNRIQSVCEELLNKLTTSRPFDLVREFALPLPLTIMAEILGVPASERERMHARIQSSISPSTIPEVLLAVPDQRLLTHQIRKLIRHRQREPRDDLLTTLVQAGNTGELTDEELIGSIFFLLVAGHETTINLITVGTLALLQHESELKRFARHPEISESAIEELLRYTSPLDLATHRFAQEELTINSVKISRGDALFAVLGSANRDESQFPDPEILNLTRAPNRHVALGQGLHFCLGAPLARLEAQVALKSLFTCFPNLRLAESPKSVLWRQSLFIRGLKRLVVEG
jgi:cytochrome P450